MGLKNLNKCGNAAITAGCSKLELIDLSHNQLKFISNSAFEALLNLRILRLNNNKCVTFDANDRSQINLIESYVAQFCQMGSRMERMMADPNLPITVQQASLDRIVEKNSEVEFNFKTNIFSFLYKKNFKKILQSF